MRIPARTQGEPAFSFWLVLFAFYFYFVRSVTSTGLLHSRKNDDCLALTRTAQNAAETKPNNHARAAKTTQVRLTAPYHGSQEQNKSVHAADRANAHDGTFLGADFPVTWAKAKQPTLVPLVADAVSLHTRCLLRIS